MRSIEEWVGKTDDAKVPDRVRLRIFLKHEGQCYLSGRPIRPGERWDLEHIVALCNGGEHRESNLAPALVAAHKDKTRTDRRLKAKTDKTQKRHWGIKKTRRKLAYRRFDGTPVNPNRRD